MPTKKLPSFLRSAAWLGFYLFLGTFVVSLLLKPLIEWVEPNLLKNLSFSETEVVLWNLYAILAGFTINLLLFLCLSAFLPRKKSVHRVEIRQFIFISVNLAMLILLGFANVFVMLFGNLTDIVISFVITVAIFSFCPYLAFALFLIYTHYIKR